MVHGIDTIKFPKNLYIPSTIKYKQVKKKVIGPGNVKKAKVTIKDAESIHHCTLIDWSNGELEQSEANKLGNPCSYIELSGLEWTEFCKLTQ